MQSINLKFWKSIKAFIGIFCLIVTCDFNVYQLTEFSFLICFHLSSQRLNSSIFKLEDMLICWKHSNMNYWPCHGLYFLQILSALLVSRLANIMLMWTSSLSHISSNIFLFGDNQKERKRINFLLDGTYKEERWWKNIVK